MMKTSRHGFALCLRGNRAYSASGRKFRCLSVPASLLSFTGSTSSTSTALSINAKQRHNNSATQLQQQVVRYQSSSPLSACDHNDDSLAPVGDLFQFPEVSTELIGLTGSIRRSFGPQSNAEAMITCGGDALAAHASFDPNYGRARDWIRAHPVGDYLLSPVLVSGLVGTLVEAAFPKSVAVGSSMNLLRPLIVGVEVRAKIEVVSVEKTGGSSLDESENRTSVEEMSSDFDVRKRKKGHCVELQTGVFRVNDEVKIAEGTHNIWIPDYLHM